MQIAVLERYHDDESSQRNQQPLIAFSSLSGSSYQCPFLLTQRPHGYFSVSWTALFQMAAPLHLRVLH